MYYKQQTHRSQLFALTGLLPYLLIVFLNAFVDLGHKIIIQNTVFKVYDGQTQIVLTAIVNGLILLPFVITFSTAGFCSDRFAKVRVMQASAVVAVPLTMLITLLYYLGWFWPAFAMTFLLALQSAFFSPAKYGFIKELAGKENLAAINGLVQAVTTVAILGGIFAFSVLFEILLIGNDVDNTGTILSHIWVIGILLVVFSLVECAIALRLPKQGWDGTQIVFDWKKYVTGGYLKRNLMSVYSKEAVMVSIIGLSIFWSISQVVLAAFPAHAKASMDITNTVLIQGMMACAGIGIIIGSLFAGRISRNYIEIGLVPVSAVGIALCLLLLTSIYLPVVLTILFFVWGMLGGMFLVPLNALLQFHSREGESGRILAGNNFIQNVVMLSFLLLSAVFALAGVDSVGLFFLLSFIAVCCALYTMYKFPQSMVRFVVSWILGSQYRIRVIGLNNLPESGGVLLLGNHISWLDWAIIQLASPRTIRFVMVRTLYQRWYLCWLLKLFGVIPISGAGSRSALREIHDNLNRGEVVCLFPEGAISRTGQIARFHKGFEKAAVNAHAVIVPFYLRGLWGSRFSRSSNKLKNARKTRLRRDIVVAFGRAIAIDSSRDTVKQRIFDLSVDSWKSYITTLPQLASAFVNAAKTNARYTMIADPVAGSLSGAQLLTTVICLSRIISRGMNDQNIGLLFPVSNAGAIANLAGLMAGKTLVNLNYTLKREELQTVVATTEITTILCSLTFLDMLKQRSIDIAETLAGTRLVYIEDLQNEIKTVTELCTFAYVRLFPAWVLRLIYCPTVLKHSPAAIVYASDQHGVLWKTVLSHTQIMANLKQISDVLNTEEDDALMATIPLFDAFGLTVTTCMPLLEGIPLVCHSDPVDVINIAKSIARYKATILCSTSRWLRLYIGNQQVYPLMLDSLRMVVAGGEQLHKDVRDGFKNKFSKDMYESYGIAEIAPVVSVNIPDVLDTSDWIVQIGNKPGTVGLPLPGVCFRIVDPETLHELAIGQDGLILIGGCQITTDCFNQQEETNQATTDIDGKQWYKTGDTGHLDEDGFLTIVDYCSRFADNRMS